MTEPGSTREPETVTAPAAGGDGADLLALWKQCHDEVTDAFKTVDWGETEIEAAQARHPRQADLLYHAWGIILPPAIFPHTEFVYRGHMRELLERVAAGEDTRPGTYAEVCIVCREASALAPLTTSATGLYLRAWAKAFPGNPVMDDDGDGTGAMAGHIEGLRGQHIDEIEREVRAKIGRRNPDRRIPKDFTCEGQHHGKTVDCRFIPGTLDDAPAPAVKRPRPSIPRATVPPDDEFTGTLF